MCLPQELELLPQRRRLHSKKIRNRQNRHPPLEPEFEDRDNRRKSQTGLVRIVGRRGQLGRDHLGSESDLQSRGDRSM